MTFGEYARQKWTELDGLNPGSERRKGYKKLVRELDLDFEPYMNEQLGWSFWGLITHHGPKKTFAMLDWPKYEMMSNN